MSGSERVLSKQRDLNFFKILSCFIAIIATLCFTFYMLMPNDAFAGPGLGYKQSNKVSVSGVPSSVSLEAGDSSAGYSLTLTPSGAVQLQEGCGYCPTQDGCGPGCIDDWGYCSCTFMTVSRTPYLELVSAGTASVATASLSGKTLTVHASEGAHAGDTTTVKVRALIDAPSPNQDANQPNAYGRCSQTYNIVVTIAPNSDTPYKVKHYLQQLDGSYPSEPADTDDMIGTTGEQTAAEAKTYEGFSAGAVNQLEIADDGSTVVSIQYTRNSNSLSFESQGGSAVESQTLKFGETATEPPAPTRAGYVFGAWYTEKECTTEWDFANNTMPAQDTTLYAKWTESPAVSIIYANDGHGATDPVSEDVRPVTGVATGSSASADQGYHFLNWTLGDTSTAIGTDTTLSAAQVDAQAKASGIYVATTFKANFEANSYTIVFNANAGTGSMDEQSMVYDQSAKLDACAFNLPGYTFAGWATEASGSVAYADTASVTNLSDEDGGTVELFAIWTENPKITISYASADATMGKVDPASESLSPAKGTAVGSVATAAPGYYFVNWTNNKNDTVSSDAKLSAAQVDAVAKASGIYEPVSFTANFAACTPVVDNPPISESYAGDGAKDTGFIFNITAKGNTAGLTNNPMPGGASEQSINKTFTGEGSIDFGNITFTVPGTYTYEVTRKNDEQANWGYPDDVYLVSYEVTQEGDELKSVRTITHANGTVVQAADFTNVYTAPQDLTKAEAKTAVTKTKSSVIPRTGDSANLVFLGILLASLGAIAIAWYAQRRCKD